MCKHNYATLTHHAEIVTDDLFDNFYFEFYGWQCDICGMLLNRDVTYDQMHSGAAATFDTAAYQRGLDAALCKVFDIPESRPEIKAVQFVQMATAHRGGHNGKR
jgi:hypothetical protein